MLKNKYSGLKYKPLFIKVTYSRNRYLQDRASAHPHTNEPPSPNPNALAPEFRNIRTPIDLPMHISMEQY